jgi:hypothetical protein
MKPQVPFADIQQHMLKCDITLETTCADLSKPLRDTDIKLIRDLDDRTKEMHENVYDSDEYRFPPGSPFANFTKASILDILRAYQEQFRRILSPYNGPTLMR